VNKVIKILKHVFIPHEHNDFKPHFFREASVAVIFGIALVLLLISAGTDIYINKTDMTAAVLPAVLVDLTNDVRQSNGEMTLSRNSTLDEAAQMKANDMANYGYFAHTSPNGVTPWYWFSQVGYNFSYAGENLAIDFTESVDVENAWLNSPTHKANILNDKFTEIGIATAEGYYNGHPTVFVVQMFGKPVFVSKITPSESDPIFDSEVKEVEEKIEIPQPFLVALNSDVKGEAITTLDQELETIENTDEFIFVKNTLVEPEEIEKINETQNQIQSQKYSTWYERFIFLTPSYIDKIYRIFIYIVIISLILMTVIEIKRQHPKNIMYGIFLIVIIFILVYINKSIFLIDFLS